MRRTGFTVTFLAVTVAVILAALIMETSRGPQFRAAEYSDMNDCIRNIPPEWLRGSIEYDGAETACFYVHRPDQPSTP